MMGKIGFVLFFVGFGGVAGALELDKSYVVPVMAVVIGYALIALEARKGVAKVEKNNSRYNNGSNVNSYPSYLERARRRANS